MTSIVRTEGRGAALGALLLLSSTALSTALAQDAPIVLPGAPGQDAQALSAEEAIKVSDARYSPADVAYLQAMIPHHYQAVVMARMAPERTNNEDVLAAAGRIERSQLDEISFMQTWLSDRGEDAPDPESTDHMHEVSDEAAKAHRAMGMATPEQIAQLEAAQGTEFDRMFLDLMIPHHEGAVTMTDTLLHQPGSAYEPRLFDFTGELVNDQTAEINRMNRLLAGLSEDERVGLAAGVDDAGQAAKNLTLLASLPKPPGFFDPSNPAGLPPVLPAEDEAGDQDDTPEDRGEETAEEEAADEAETASREEGESGDSMTQYVERYPHLAFWNTDMAFAGDTLVTGNYHGFNIYKLDQEGMPTLTSSVVCPGGQGDVSIVGDLLIMSVEQTRGRVDCGLQGIEEDVSEERFRGLRIFDISDLSRPKQVGQVQTCRGSHTHSVVAADRRRIVVYNSGTSSIRDEKELEGCVEGLPGEERSALFSIDVIEIPVRRPERARIISSPRVFADDETGRIAGLWSGGDHGEGTQETRRTDQCHDITVFPEKNLAAGACSGNGILLDISDPMKPKRIDAVNDDGFAYWHSATFNNDGTKVIFTDEWGGGVQPRCKASDPMNWGADAIYRIEDGKLVYESHYKMPAPQSDTENCVAHNGSVVPVPGRDLFVQAWYQGGLSVMDFTDEKDPVEVAYFDRGPIMEDRTVIGGYWSTYYYDGKIYGTEIVRGLDVMALEPSEYLTENELAAAALADFGDAFNPQQQFPVSWPAEPVVAKAYIDQLVRSGTVTEDAASRMMATLDQAAEALSGSGRDRDLAGAVEGLAEGVSASDAQGQERVAALTGTLAGIAGRLR
ncbi:DUF305 domain-containing protein [Parvularcula dongshanensis]|uniref:Uncharacterized protein (DUF305 family) n=1 Tax=Parvularcula dongshanensis TaxID=1173995 RepID=A0A840I579_9PROT|nr:DUF305 domain-containing protein [Parvularcula dongshanensis]MBB4659180.1 uncharacterized protein (DUF305 family) [Parvularcula dongshanensis]